MYQRLETLDTILQARVGGKEVWLVDFQRLDLGEQVLEGLRRLPDIVAGRRQSPKAIRYTADTNRNAVGITRSASLVR